MYVESLIARDFYRELRDVFESKPNVLAVLPAAWSGLQYKELSSKAYNVLEPQSGISLDWERFVAKRIGYIFLLTQLPLIVDDFKTSEERDLWRLNQLTDEEFNLQTFSAMRPSILMQGWQQALFLLEWVHIDALQRSWGGMLVEHANYMRRFHDSIENYEELPRAEQIEITQAIQNQAVLFLALLDGV